MWSVSRQILFQCSISVTVSQLAVSFELERYLLSVFFQSYFPGMIMVILGGLSMFLDAKSVPARVSMGKSYFLTKFWSQKSKISFLKLIGPHRCWWRILELVTSFGCWWLTWLNDSTINILKLSPTSWILPSCFQTVKFGVKCVPPIVLYIKGVPVIIFYFLQFWSKLGFRLIRLRWFQKSNRFDSRAPHPRVTYLLKSPRFSKFDRKTTGTPLK